LFLAHFSGKVFVSATVEKEATAKQSFDAMLIMERVKEKKIRVKKAGKRQLVEKIAKDFKLHWGEAETLALCIENNWQLVGTDDFNAIKACIVLQIKFASAISILLLLNSEKTLDKKGALLRLKKLEYFGRYSQEIISDAEKRLK
jgi:predicted nucleic acid-binding protein